MSDTINSPDNDNQPATFREKAIQEAREWLSVFAWFVPLYLLFTGLIYEQRVIPSESMVPNLQVGDRVAVNKFAYGYSKYSVPFGLGWFLPNGRIFAAMPERGDVVVFQHPHTDRVMIKRVIAVGGDEIQMKDTRLYLNGEPVPTQDLRRITVMTHPTRHDTSHAVSVVESRETLGDKSYLVHQWDAKPGRPNATYDNTGPFIVPEGHLFFVGDNRDNSVDARSATGHCMAVNGVISAAGCPAGENAAIGFVPLENVIGRADTVIFTTKRCKAQTGITCPPKRVWQGL